MHANFRHTHPGVTNVLIAEPSVRHRSLLLNCTGTRRYVWTTFFAPAVIGF